MQSTASSSKSIDRPVLRNPSIRSPAFSSSFAVTTSEFDRALGICGEMRPKYAKGVNLEAGGPGALYPNMTESPELRWAFIRKVHFILTLQLALTTAVAAVVVSFKPVAHFFVSSGAGLGIYTFFAILPLILLCPLYMYQERHPVNLLLFPGLFTVSISFSVGMTCAFTNGSVSTWEIGHDDIRRDVLTRKPQLPKRMKAVISCDDKENGCTDNIQREGTIASLDLCTAATNLPS